MKNNFLTLLTLILFIMISSALFADETTDIIKIKDTTEDSQINHKKKQKIVSFRFIVNFSMNPYIYNPHANSNGNGLNWGVVAGVRVKKITIATGIRMNYFSFTSSTDFGGAWSIIAGNLSIFYKPRSWFEFSAGIGASWYSSSFSYKTSIDEGVEHKNEAGLSLDFNLAFTPWHYITIETPTRLDLFFDSTGHKMTPYFYGGIRVDFHPYFSWLNIYIETGGIPWLYTGNYINVQTGFFVWSIGTSIDFDSITTINSVKTLQQKLKIKKSRQTK